MPEAMVFGATWKAFVVVVGDVDGRERIDEWRSRRELRVARSGFAEAASRKEDRGGVVMRSVARLRGRRSRRR